MQTGVCRGLFLILERFSVLGSILRDRVGGVEAVSAVLFSSNDTMPVSFGQMADKSIVGQAGKARCPDLKI